VLPTIAGNLKAGQVVVDLVGVPQGELGPASYVGACW
jgi:hypothetical protein